MKKLIILISLFSMSYISGHEKYDYVANADGLAIEAAKEMCKRHKFLHVFGLGGDMMDEVELVAISFSCNRKLAEHEMRDLLVEGTLLLQNKINSAEKLRPYLSHYPFTSKGIKIAIFTYPKEICPDELSFASASKGKIRYYKEENTRDDVILTESFEEALEKVDVEQIMQPKEKPSFLTRIKNLYRN